MPKIVPKQTDLKIEADFAAPAFNLMFPASEQLHGHLFSLMQRFGLTVNDINIDTPGPNLGTRGITFHLARVQLIIRLQLSRVEFTFGDLSKISMQDGVALFNGVFAALRGVFPKLQIATYGATIGMHAVIEGQAATEFINARIQGEPKGLGATTGHAIAYYFGQDGPRQKLVVVVDASALVPGGVYIRNSIDVDGAAIVSEEFPEFVRSEFYRTLKGFDLELLQ